MFATFQEQGRKCVHENGMTTMANLSNFFLFHKFQQYKLHTVASGKCVNKVLIKLQSIVQHVQYTNDFVVYLLVIIYNKLTKIQKDFSNFSRYLNTLYVLLMYTQS